MNSSTWLKNRVITTIVNIILPIGVTILLFSEVAWSGSVSPVNTQSNKPGNAQVTKLDDIQAANLFCRDDIFPWAGFWQSKTQSKSQAIHSDGKTTITTVENCQSGKTLWDVLGLIVVPLSLAILGFWFQKLQKDQVDKKAAQEKAAADSKLREASVQNYLDKMSELLIDKQIISLDPKHPTRNGALIAASARTKSILVSMEKDGERKGRILQFLYSAKFLTDLKLDLVGADMSYAQLIYAKLENAVLEGVNLSGADLRGANLKGAILTSANLRNADLSTDPDLVKNNSFPQQFPTNLENAALYGTDLRGAKLMGVNFCNAKLGQANIEGADIKYADLTNLNVPLDIKNVKSAINWKLANYESGFRKRLDL
jgi:Pentapeptide repeats (8 copies)